MSGLRARRHPGVEKAPAAEVEPDDDEGERVTHEDDDKIDRLKMTLMEEILMLGLKDKEGHTSFWNDCISTALRGCVLIELGLRGRLALEATGARKRPLALRRVQVINEAPTGDAILDEALKLMKDTKPGEPVPTWVELLSGEVWNPLRMGYQLKNVRERLAKNLVEKGLLTTEKHNFVLFEMTTHPLTDSDCKKRLVKRLQELLLVRWSNDPHKMDKRALSIIVMASSADVMENSLLDLTDEQYELASRRLRDLLDRDFEKEASQPGTSDVMWAVFSSFNR